MKARLLAAAAALPARTLLLAMAGVLLLLAAESWLLVLRPAWTEYRQLRQAREATERPVAGAPAAAAIEQARAELDRLHERLRAGSSDQPPDQLVLGLVDRLSRLASARGVALGAVRPGSARRVLKFDEQAFDIQVRGRYGPLADWLRDIERELAPVAVSRFTIKQGDAPGGLSMEVRLVAYRPAAKAEPGR